MKTQIMVFTSTGKFVGNSTEEMDEIELGECALGHIKQGNIIIFVDDDLKDGLMKIIRIPD